MKTAVEFYREQNIELLEELRLGLITHLHWYQKQAIIFEQAKEMEKEQMIEFACQVAEASAMKYIQGKTTRMIAEELINNNYE